MLSFMTTVIQIRSVPPELHRRLKARAAMEGVSMSEYILREVGKALERPTRAEVLARIRARGPKYLKTTAADDLRAECKEREAHLGALHDRSECSALFELILTTPTDQHEIRWDQEEALAR
jgi:hypothetical protein